MLNVLLPGYSKNNKEELESITAFLQENQKEVYKHEWLHWHDENVRFDIDTEVEIIQAEIKGLDNFGIIAKSIGTVVTVHLLQKLNVAPKFVILMGIPLDSATEYKQLYQKALSTEEFPVTIIQNDTDPLGTIGDVRSFLGNIKYDEYAPEANEHRYNYPELVWDIIQNFEGRV